MAHQVIWSNSALADVETIVDYMMPRGEQTARRVGASIFDSAEVLGTFPGIGPIFKRSRGYVIREILSGRYRVFDIVDDQQQRVAILVVWHSARRDPDPKQLLDRFD